MKLTVKAGLAVGVLALGAGSAYADTVVLGPGPIPLPGSANGGVVLSVWNDSTSIARYLSLGINNIQPPTLTPSGGLLLDFGTIDGSAFGSNPTGLTYSVVAGDYNGGDPSQWTVAFTGALNQTSVTGANGDSMANALNNLTNFVNATNVACGATAPCVATSANGWYAANFASTLGNNLPFAANGAVGTALSFWLLSSTSDLGGDDATLTRYENASGIGKWLLTNIVGTTNYHLTYEIAGNVSTVPLPAAAWLLISGLAGFGVVGRRRKVA